MARGSIVKRGKIYSIVYYVGTKQKWEAIGPTKREARSSTPSDAQRGSTTPRSDPFWFFH